MFSQLAYDERKVLKYKLELMYSINYIIENKKIISYIVNIDYNKISIKKFKEICNAYEYINTNQDYIKISNINFDLLKIGKLGPEDIYLLLKRVSDE